ncbi:short-chain alcohol protein [Pochonia chlamydosporia 170]|uniref:Short-chain alcohol protein n=1 Tax=Pochonia chlamydosporia 170 TaxID=1380566 RepID=A0A179FH70_METCM|nr:short-chain alcohol protein [Pochonia chlamydosporia 170]OAQ64601.1 short-chain alcohol protein [Pochonia chlamydosporia 170]
MVGSRHSLVLIGCGPGIGRSIASVFASKRYDTIGLVARRQSQLDADRKAVEAVAPGTKVHTYVADIADGPSLKETLKQISYDIGIPETVYFNAAVIRPTSISDETEEAMIYDFKITNTALLHTAQWAFPQLVSLAQSDAMAKPSFLVTGTWISRDPVTQIFTLSLVKAAQRNLTQSLAQVYGPQGVHVGMVRVMGVVDPKTLSPESIAEKAWELFDEPKDKQAFEMEAK